MTYQAQETYLRSSYEDISLSYATIPEETLHCYKRFAVVQEEGTAESLFDKETAPSQPDTHNSTAPLSAPGYPIEASVFNASNQAEDISLVMN